MKYPIYSQTKVNFGLKYEKLCVIFRDKAW